MESPPLSDEIPARMQPVARAHPSIPRRVRGPQRRPTKKQLTMRLNQDVVEYFKLQGKGWQTKINEVLTDYMHAHTDDDSQA